MWMKEVELKASLVDCKAMDCTKTRYKKQGFRKDKKLETAHREETKLKSIMIPS
jgi:hypothetical protein